jgi:hypothetical protein
LCSIPKLVRFPTWYPNPKPKHPYGPDPGENPAPKASMGEEEMAHFK